MRVPTMLRNVFTGVALSIFLIASAGAAGLSGEKIKAPDLILQNPAGEKTHLSAYLGKKPVLLVFWASWCTICRDEIAELKKLNSRLTVIAVNEGESAWKTKRFISMNGIDYQVALDPDGALAKAMQVPGVPACAVLDKSGLIVYRGLGLPENIESYAGK